MAKPLNDLTGKGWFLAQGQESIEAMLSNGTTQSELAVMASLFKGVEKAPNAGSVSNILSGLCWGPFNGKEPAEKGERKARQSKPVSGRKGLLPARLDQSINKALTGIVDSDDPRFIFSPNWEQFKQARALQGQDWVSFIAKKLKGEEIEQFSLWVTSNDSADIAENQETEKAVSFILSIPDRREILESLRWDADITAFYGF